MVCDNLKLLHECCNKKKNNENKNQYKKKDLHLHVLPARAIYSRFSFSSYAYHFLIDILSVMIFKLLFVLILFLTQVFSQFPTEPIFRDQTRALCALQASLNIQRWKPDCDLDWTDQQTRARNYSGVRWNTDNYQPKVISLDLSK